MTLLIRTKESCPAAYGRLTTSAVVGHDGFVVGVHWHSSWSSSCHACFTSLYLIFGKAALKTTRAKFTIFPRRVEDTPREKCSLARQIRLRIFQSHRSTSWLDVKCVISNGGLLIGMALKSRLRSPQYQQSEESTLLTRLVSVVVIPLEGSSTSSHALFESFVPSYYPQFISIIIGTPCVETVIPTSCPHIHFGRTPKETKGAAKGDCESRRPKVTKSKPRVFHLQKAPVLSREAVDMIESVHQPLRPLLASLDSGTSTTRISI